MSVTIQGQELELWETQLYVCGGVRESVVGWCVCVWGGGVTEVVGRAQCVHVAGGVLSEVVQVLCKPREV